MKFQSQGLGSTLLINAIYRSIRADIAAYAIIVEPFLGNQDWALEDIM
jgi:hypothetical protein